MLITAHCIILCTFSPLQIKNKPHEGVTKPAFILEPVSTLQVVIVIDEYFASYNINYVAKN
jgi:hypothetical protein